MKRIFFVITLIVSCLFISSCGKSDAAKSADAMIESIGEVTLESESKIDNVQKTVDALSTEDRQQLENLDVLKKSHEKLSQLKAEQVISKIDAIGNVTIDSKDVITSVRREYDALGDNEKSKVKNYSTLSEAENTLKELKKARGEQILANLHVDEDKVQNCTYYMSKTLSFLSDGRWISDQRCFILPYIVRGGNSVYLRLICNYTYDSWVFFKKIIVVADDQRYTKNFNYGDITRDNGGGLVWEYSDTEVGVDDQVMLWAIANSNETTVRFEGDDYRWDFTVTSGDKAAIRDILTAYDNLK